MNELLSVSKTIEVFYLTYTTSIGYYGYCISYLGLKYSYSIINDDK